MDRRSFLRTTALGGATAGLAAPAIAGGHAMTLTMVTTWPRGLAGVWDSVERFVTNVSDITDGALTIDAKGAGELVGAFESFDAVSSGQADMYHGADYYWVNQSPAWAFFTAVPFGMTAPEMMVWYYSMGGQQKHMELGEIFGIRAFIAGNTGAQGGGWYRKEMTSPEDFQGLKFRMPGLGGQAMTAMGASVQNLPGGEIYQALASGALDGTEWIGPWSDEKLGLQEVCDHYYPAGFHEPGAALSVGCNLDVFNGLPANFQRAIEVAAADAHQHNYSLFVANNGPALQRLQAGGTRFHQFSDDIWRAFGAASQEVLGGFMDDEIFADIHDHAMASMAASSGWLSRSDGFYQEKRNMVLGG